MLDANELPQDYYMLSVFRKHDVCINTIRLIINSFMTTPPLYLTTCKVMVIVWRLRVNIIRTFFILAMFYLFNGHSYQKQFIQL